VWGISHESYVHSEEVISEIWVLFKFLQLA
jgi:hypothetical protein